MLVALGALLLAFAVQPAFACFELRCECLPLVVARKSCEPLFEGGAYLIDLPLEIVLGSISLLGRLVGTLHRLFEFTRTL